MKAATTNTEPHTYRPYPPIEGSGKDPSSEASSRIQLWDVPLRLFHWSLVTAVTTAIVAGKLGGEWMPLHSWAGIATLGLLAFRLVWGVAGSTHARFASFLPTPSQLLAYVKGSWRGIGHNPLGALSVIALLSVLALQAGSGLFSNDDIAFTGQLAGLVDEELSHQLTSWHHQLANVVFVVLGLHVVAIVFYVRVKKQNLVKPMVTGWKNVPLGTPAPRQGSAAALLLALFVGLTAAYGASGVWIKVPAAAASARTDERATTSAPASKDTATDAGHGGTNKAAPAW
jgi:cytochrome b